MMATQRSLKVLVMLVFGTAMCSTAGRSLQTGLPLVVNTWPFTNATDKAWARVSAGGTAMEAVVAGCGQCEEQRCDGSVGAGNHPDEDGETTLDAMVMDGTSMDVGSVGGLRHVADAVAVAHAVLQYTEQTLLVGELATNFALEMGFKKSDLSSNKSISDWKDWKKNNCQPNYRKNVLPDPSKSCGPYHPASHLSLTDTDTSQRRLHAGRGGRRGKALKPPGLGQKQRPPVGPDNHDTIGMVVVDPSGKVAVGTSTNGLSHKVPGRVGDSPIMGAGAYADGDVGGAASTGDGDVMMRFLPSFHIVEMMRAGTSPTSACRQAVRKIATKFPTYTGAVVAVTIQGQHAAGCYGLATFTYSVRSPLTNGTRKYTVKCVDNRLHHHKNSTKKNRR